MKYKHSQQFYTTRYNKYKAAMRRIGVVPMKEGAFIARYEGIVEEAEKKAKKLNRPVKVNPMKEIIYSSQYGTMYNSALAEKKELAKVGIKVKLEELKLMTTQEFADMYATELYAARKQFFDEGKTKDQVAALISQQWFGSK